MTDPTKSADRGHLDTERRNAASRGLDTLSTEAALAVFSAADLEAVRAVERARPALADAIDRISERLARGGQLLYVGAGTSGRLGVLDASECPPTFQSAPDQVQAAIAGGTSALLKAVEGAEDDPQAGADAVRDRDLGPDDCVVGITAGGTTPYVHGALGEARGRGALTVLLACVPASQVPDDYDVSLRLETGPEVLAGSTRLKAGTATKLALNALSTMVMTRLGKVHDNLMVDVDTSANAKLVDRGERLLMELVGLDREGAARALREAGGHVKLAAVMAHHGVDAPEAARRLEACGGLLRAALEG